MLSYGIFNIIFAILYKAEHMICVIGVPGVINTEEIRSK